MMNLLHPSPLQRAAASPGWHRTILLLLLVAAGLSRPAQAQTNNALAFDGSNDFVSVANSTSLSNIPTAVTVEAWFRTSVTGEKYIATKGDDSFYLAMQGGGGLAGVVSWYVNGPSGPSGGWLYGTTNLADNRWHHVAGTYDGATLSLYVDGSLQNSRAATGAIQSGGTHSLDIGMRTGGSFWNGSLDNVRVYSTALTASQLFITERFSATPTGGVVVASYDFNRGVAGGSNAGVTALPDASGNGNHGLLNNFALSGTASNWVRSCPTITSVSPLSGSAGTSVTITGTNLLDATNALFNGTTVSVFSPASDASVTVSVPASATSGVVSLVSPVLFTTFIGPSFVVGTPNNALDFDGVDDAVSVASNAALNLTSAFTIEAWIKPVGAGPVVQDIICKSSSTQNTGYIFPRTDDNWNNLRIWLFRGGGWGQYTVPYAGNIGTWHHVAATYDGTTVLMYVDGVLVPSTPSGNNPTGPVSTNTNPLTLGNQPGFAENYRGALDETRVYSAVLTNAQIRSDMFSTFSALPANQVAYYDFDQGIGGGSNGGLTSLPDASGNGRTGTLSNFALTGTTSNWVRSFPTINGLSQSSGPVGTSLFVTGTNLIDATSFRFNGTAAPTFTASGDYLASVSVPVGATTGVTSLASANLTAYNGPVFTVTPAPDLVVSTMMTIAAGIYNNITVTGPNGFGTLGGNVAVNGALLVQNGGTLSDGCNLITGPGTFTLAAGGTLAICRPFGILAVGDAQGNVGTVRVTGGRSFSSDANYVYTGSDATGSGLPSQVRNLSIVVPGNVALTLPTSVAQALTLSSSGNLVLGGNALTLLSSAAGTALVVNSGTGAVVGNATVQRYLDPSLNAGLGYRHYSAPVSNSTVADLATAGFAPVVNPAYNSSLTPNLITPFPTVFGYDQSRVTLSNTYAPFDRGFLSPNGSADPLVVGRGYAVNLAASALVDFVGTLTSGTQTPLALNRVAGNTDAGWQLVGNPYPAPLDYSLVAPADRASLDAAIYVYSSTNQYNGQYRAYANGVGNPVLPVAQGFFVRVSAGQTSGTLTFRNSQRLTAPDNTPFQRSAADARPLVQLDLRSASGATDALYAYAEAGATSAYDSQFDAVKLPNSTGLNLASVASTSESLAIDGRPAFTASTVLPLTVGVPAAGTYSLTAAALTNLPAGLDAFLTDAFTGQRVNLRTQPAYSFTLTGTQAATLVTGRFTLRFAASSPLATAAGLTAADVTVYPNPAHERFQVLVPATAGRATVQAELLNTLGQVVRRQTAGNSFTVETAGLATGVYTLRLHTGSTTLAKRVVVQ